MAYKYLLWDIDNTVLDFLAAESAAIKNLFIEFGFGECSDEAVARYSAINTKYWKALERNEIEKNRMLAERFRVFFSGEGVDPDRAEEFNAKYQVALGDTIVFKDDAYNILKGEKGRFVLAAITNGTAVAQEKKLRKSGLAEIFDHVFISEEVGAEKPNREFFEAAISEMQIADLKEALIIGDSLTSDIRGGVNMGIDTCWYNPDGKPNDTDLTPTYVIRNLNEVEAIL